MNRHLAQAIDHVEAVKAAAQALRDEYAQPVHDRTVVADLNAEISRGLKLAEVEAQLAIATAISDRRQGVTL